MASNKPTNASGAAETQAQQGSAEPDLKEANKPEKNSDEIQFFDTTISKLVERENEDGDTEWVEVMSDNLYPGEKLKRADDEEKAAKKADYARKAALHAAADRRATEARIDERHEEQTRP